MGDALTLRADGLTFECTTPSAGGGAGSSTFVDLTDTPAAITANQCVQGDATGDVLTFAACGGADTNDYVDSIAHAVSGTLLTTTLGRTGSLADLTATATLPSGGGGGGTASVAAFKCVLEDVAGATYASATQIMNCATANRINHGTFVVEAASATDATHRIVVPAGEGGLYDLVASVFTEHASGGIRSILHAAFSVERSGTVTVLPDEGSGYLRDAAGAELIAVDHTSIAAA